MIDASVSLLESPLREVENLTRVFKERDKFYKEEEKFYSDYVKKLNYENQLLLSKLEGYEKCEAKLAEAEALIIHLKGKLEKYRSNKKILEDKYAKEYETIKATATEIAEHSNELNNKIKELQLNEINLQSQISILEATNESKAEKIKSILNDLTKLKEEVNNTMVSKIYFNQMESKYSDETVPLEIYMELKSNLDALSSEIEENFVDRDEYLQLEDKLNKTKIEKFLVEESVSILTTDKHNLSKLILEQKHMIDSLNETINTKNSEICQHIDAKKSLENSILEIKHSLESVSGDQDPVKVQLREEIDSLKTRIRLELSEREKLASSLKSSQWSLENVQNAYDDLSHKFKDTNHDCLMHSKEVNKLRTILDGISSDVDTLITFLKENKLLSFNPDLMNQNQWIECFDSTKKIKFWKNIKNGIKTYDNPNEFTEINLGFIQLNDKLSDLSKKIEIFDSINVNKFSSPTKKKSVMSPVKKSPESLKNLLAEDGCDTTFMIDQSNHDLSNSTSKRQVKSKTIKKKKKIKTIKKSSVETLSVSSVDKYTKPQVETVAPLKKKTTSSSISVIMPSVPKLNRKIFK